LKNEFFSLIEKLETEIIKKTSFEAKFKKKMFLAKFVISESFISNIVPKKLKINSTLINEKLIFYKFKINLFFICY
jgi:hypothetical protein